MKSGRSIFLFCNFWCIRPFPICHGMCLLELFFQHVVFCAINVRLWPPRMTHMLPLGPGPARILSWQNISLATFRNYRYKHPMHFFSLYSSFQC
jgi:hypothetical protein